MAIGISDAVEHRMVQVHTLHTRMSPSFESHYMLHLYLAHECVRQADSVIDRPTISFQPAGRVEDVDVLEQSGHRFLNCAYGKFDQHGLPANLTSNTVSSIDLMWAGLRLDELLPEFVAMKQIVSENDLTGENVASPHRFSQSMTPDTPRHARNIGRGLNDLYSDTPENAVWVMSNVFGCIEQVILRHIVPQSAEFKANFDYRKLFLFDGFMFGAEDHFRAILGPTASQDDVDEQVNVFRHECEAALLERQAHWVQGRWDVERNWNQRKISIATRTTNGVVAETVTLAFGPSDSDLAGAVTRLGNRGKHRDRRQSWRDSASVTIQFRSQAGRFVISTTGITLERVAAALRKADLEARGVTLSERDLGLLDRVGELTFEDRHGKEVHALFFPEFRTSVGNGYEAKPDADLTPLTVQQIVDITIAALAKA